jgi:hypothetical protein
MRKKKLNERKLNTQEQIDDIGNKSDPNIDMNTNDNSAIYIYNKETGKWEVRNPAGSLGYNYLYRED